MRDASNNCLQCPWHDHKRKFIKKSTHIPEADISSVLEWICWAHQYTQLVHWSTFFEAKESNERFREIPTIQNHWKLPTLLWDGAQTTLLVGLSLLPQKPVTGYLNCLVSATTPDPCDARACRGWRHTHIAAQGSDTLLSQAFCCWHLSPVQNLL